MTALFALLGTLSGGNCGVTSSRSRSFDVSSLIGLSPSNDNSRSQRSGSCSPPPPMQATATTPRILAPSSANQQSQPSPNVSVGPPAPPPTAPPVAPSGLYPFLLHPGLYQHLITGMCLSRTSVPMRSSLPIHDHLIFTITSKLIFSRF